MRTIKAKTIVALLCENMADDIEINETFHYKLTKYEHVAKKILSIILF